MTTYIEKDYISYAKLDEEFLCECNKLLEKFNFTKLGEIQRIDIQAKNQLVILQAQASATIELNGYIYQLRRHKNRCWLFESGTRLNYKSNTSFIYTGVNQHPLIKNKRFVFIEDMGQRRCALYYPTHQSSDEYEWDEPILALQY